jgi:hypothetical protein
MGSAPFWDYASTVQNLNILLSGTDSYLPEEKPHHQIKVGMTEKLIKHSKTEKLQNVVTLCKWLFKVKQIDDRMHIKHQEFEGIATMSSAQDLP